MIKEHDLVKTRVDKEGFPAGTKGVVVSIYSSGPAYEAEVWDENDYPIDVITYGLDEVMRCDDHGTQRTERNAA